MFGCSDWGHIHRKADSPCAGTKIIPDKIFVHISNGDFDPISVTERSCVHASSSIKGSVTYRIDFFPSLSLKLLQIFLKVSPKFFKNRRLVTFKCTASVKCHFFFWQLNFLKRKNPLRPKSFSLWLLLCKYSPVVHSRRRSQMFVAILKNVVLFPNHWSQTSGSPYRVKLSRCDLLSLTSKHWIFFRMFYKA